MQKGSGMRTDTLKKYDAKTSKFKKIIMRDETLNSPKKIAFQN